MKEREGGILNFHGDDVVPSAPEEALFHVIPVPYEKTVSYGTGTAGGPAAILAASCQLELFDGKSVPAELGIYTGPPVACEGEPEEVLAVIGRRVTASLGHGAIPVVLGGEHTISAPVAEALAAHHGTIGVIQFDAHADLRDEYDGTPLSHACVMKRIFDLEIPFVQIGTRSYSLEEQRLREREGVTYFDAERIFRKGIEAVLLPEGFPEKIFLTFDIDCLDPSLIPATGTPVPGGLTWYQALWIIEKILQKRICTGFDVVELAPQPHHPGSAFASAQLVYAIMGYLTRSRVNRTFYEL